MYPKISAVMCTYGRFSFVERQMNCFLNQSYPNKELIIFNTDIDSPYLEQEGLREQNIFIYNCNIDSLTQEPYTNVGAIRRDALTLATGDYYVCWDDDDVHLPWFMEQGIDRINETGKPFFKPERSFFYSGDYLRLVKNTLEASIVCNMDKVREYGFLLETGKEGLAWYTKARDNKELNENDSHYIPSYCFDWNSNPTDSYQHRQSGNIDHPENFVQHKQACLDKVNDRGLTIYDKQKMRETYNPYFDYMIAYKSGFPQDLFEKYFTPQLNLFAH